MEPHPSNDGHAPTDHPSGTSAFTDAEWEQLRGEDFAAGKAVVVLMLGIFSIGVFLYACVAFTVWRGMGFLS
jgi:hypothetical protein